MTRRHDQELLRRLHGESRPNGAGESRGQERGRPEADIDGPLAVLWSALEPPAADPAPAGFTGRVMARVREETGGRVGWASLPVGASARWTAAAALTAGLVAGAGLGGWTVRPSAEPLAAAEGISNPMEDTDRMALAAAVAATLAADTAGSETSLDHAVDQVVDPGSPVDPELAESYLAALVALEDVS